MSVADTNGNGKSVQTLLMAGGIVLSILISALSGVFQLINPRGDITAVDYRVAANLAASESRLQHEIDELKADTRTDIRAIKDLLKSFVRNDTYAEHGVRITDSILAMRGQLTDVAKDYASKDNLKQITLDLTERLTALSNRLNKNEEQMFGTYNPGKQLENLQNQVNEMRRQMTELVTAMNSNKVTPVLPLSPTPNR